MSKVQTHQQTQALSTVRQLRCMVSPLLCWVDKVACRAIAQMAGALIPFADTYENSKRSDRTEEHSMTRIIHRVIPSLPPERQFTNNNIKIDEHHYGKRVAAEFADGDIRGAVREIFSLDNLAIHNEETLAALSAHHPPAPLNILLLLPLNDKIIAASVGQDAVRQAINDLLAQEVGEAGIRLSATLTNFVNAVHKGDVPEKVRRIFYPSIAVGNTLKRIAVKAAAKQVNIRLGQHVRPIQLSLATRGGCEAAARITRRYLTDVNRRRVLLKIDMRIAYNSIHRDVVLTAVREYLQNYTI
ncbi:hypothetical protein GJ496_001120 [Pomphorhynchus laevis]|nr:hypothetical protein GJ496_001120 [Pomphorhynchus laevis]